MVSLKPQSDICINKFVNGKLFFSLPNIKKHAVYTQIVSR